MSNRGVKSVLWWICLVMAPAVLLTIELFHPAGFTAQPGMYQFLSKPELNQPQFMALAYFGPNWWFTLHMIQTPMVGLVSIGLWLLVDPIDRADGTLAVALAWLARLATFVFLIYYTALDAIGGFGLGRTILTAQNMVADGKLNPQQLDGIVQLLNAVWVDPSGWRRRLLHQLDRVVGDFRGHRACRACVAAGTKGGLAATDRPCGVRLGAAGKSCRDARADRIRPAHHRLDLAVVVPPPCLTVTPRPLAEDVPRAIAGHGDAVHHPSDSRDSR